ncbi:Crp/Fnr family transcriptional regulator [Oceanobacillus sp. Castelsardo]|uniref:Crp/Fnr family transcriptional regulator n=1 Tax=Oceanobacillus sp. Castelsardo TaxID=1851204 RepID=UPI000837D43F|nr:Crp/Fnr family transcriptional regulator [Oceanobacillus sp. Castelsardo]
MTGVIIENSKWTPYLKYGERRFYRRKSIIYEEKQDGFQGFYYIRSGLIKISSTIYTGKQQIIDIVCSENPFGEQVVDGGSYFSTATAITDSIVYVFSIERIQSVLKEDENFRKLFYQSLIEKLKILSNNVLSDSLPSEILLARTLIILKEKFISDQFPFTQQELCYYTNLNRNTIYHIFKKWNGRVASLDKRSIIIHNIGALKEIAAIKFDAHEI